MANLKKNIYFCSVKIDIISHFPCKIDQKQVHFTMRSGGAKCEQSKLYHISLICTTSFN